MTPREAVDLLSSNRANVVGPHTAELWLAVDVLDRMLNQPTDWRDVSRRLIDMYHRELHGYEEIARERCTFAHCQGMTNLLGDR